MCLVIYDSDFQLKVRYLRRGVELAPPLIIGGSTWRGSRLHARRSHLRMSSRHLRDSGFTVATLIRDSVLAPAKAAVAVLLVFANHSRGHLRGRSRHQVGAGGLRLGGRRVCTGKVDK